MKSNQFDLDIKDGRFRVFAQNFTSAAELVRYCVGRSPTPGVEEYNHFNGVDPWDKHWSDFRSSAELVKLVETGVMNKELLNEVGRYARTAQVKDEEKLTQKYLDVAGGCPVVPLFLTGTPTCMYSIKKKKVKSRIVKLCIFCKALSHISTEDYKRAGELITKTVAKLEKAGYRIRLLAMDAYEDRNYMNRPQETFDGRHGIWVVTHMIKRENEPMNYRRIMFPLTRMAYHRGLGFGWMAVNGAPCITGLGGSIERVIRNDDDREKMFARACGEDDYIILSQDDVIGYIDQYGQEKAQKIIDAKVMSLS